MSSAYRDDEFGNPVFVATPSIDKKSADRLLARIVAQALKLLRRRGIISAEEWLAPIETAPDAQLTLEAMRLPFWVDAPARVDVRLPSASLFNNATVENGHGEARLAFKTPLVLRLGFEWRPIAGLRIELAGAFEGWSIHDRIDILHAGKGTNLLGVTGFPSPYAVGDLTIARNFRDTFKVAIGAEYVGGTKSLGFKLRAGFSYDRSAVPVQYFNVHALDPDKFTPSIGASLVLGKLSLDLVYAHVFGLNTTVDPASARVYALSPVRGPAVEQTAVNGGDYTLQANVIGLGMTYRFD